MDDVQSGSWVIRRGGNDCSNGSMVTSGASGTSATLTSAQAMTSDKYRVCVTDAAGNTGASADFEIIKETSTTTTLARTAGSNPSNFGSPVTFTATVTAAGGNPGTGQGTVTFLDNLVAIPSCTNVSLTTNTAGCTISTLAGGAHSITATFNGFTSAGPNGQTWDPSTSGAVAHSVNAGDVIAPSNVSIDINGGAAWTNTTSVSLHIHGEDNVGVTGYFVANGGTATCLAEPFASYTAVGPTTSHDLAALAHSLSAGDGTKTVCVVYRDAAGPRLPRRTRSGSTRSPHRSA